MNPLTERSANFAADWLRFQSLYKLSAKKVGLTDNFITVLYAILQHPTSCTQKYLVDHTFLPKQTIHFVVQKLMSQGIISIEVSETDSRVNEIKLTQDGHQYIQETIVPFVTATQNALNDFSAADQQKLLALFHEYVTKLDSQLKSGLLR